MPHQDDGAEDRRDLRRRPLSAVRGRRSSLAAAVRRLERRAGTAPALIEPAVRAMMPRSTRLKRPTSILMPH